MKFILSDAAAEEGYAVAAWYDRQRIGLGDQFLDEFTAKLESLRQFPDSFPPWEIAPGMRRAALGRFPYVIAFRVRPGDILVIAIAHASRGPRFWRERLQGEF